MKDYGFGEKAYQLTLNVINELIVKYLPDKYSSNDRVNTDILEFVQWCCMAYDDTLPDKNMDYKDLVPFIMDMCMYLKEDTFMDMYKKSVEAIRNGRWREIK